MQQLPFIPGQRYNRRRDIHGIYGGNWQGGICPSASYPYIFIFTGASGHQHGYEDGWDNENIFTYTGEGQLGDMAWEKTMTICSVKDGCNFSAFLSIPRS